MDFYVNYRNVNHCGNLIHYCILLVQVQMSILIQLNRFYRYLFPINALDKNINNRKHNSQTILYKIWKLQLFYKSEVLMIEFTCFIIIKSKLRLLLYLDRPNVLIIYDHLHWRSHIQFIFKLNSSRFVILWVFVLDVPK